MIRMTEQDIREFVLNRVKEDELRGFDGLDFYCIPSKEKWTLALNIDGVSQVVMISQREQSRTFASLDSAYKVASSIINSMIVIGR